MTVPTSSDGNAVIDRMSVMTTDTAVSARSMTESIMSLYGHQSYYAMILDPREGKFDMAPEMLVDHTRISTIIEDHLHSKDATQPPDLHREGGRDTDAWEPSGEQRSKPNVDNEVTEAEATQRLWNWVDTYNRPIRSKSRWATSSEGSVGSIASTVMTRASDVIQIAYIPGATNRLIDSTPGLQAALAEKPLPPIPIESNSTHHARPPEWAESTYPYHAALASYTAKPDNRGDPEELSFVKYEVLEVGGVDQRWWSAKNEVGKKGIVPRTELRPYSAASSYGNPFRPGGRPAGSNF